MQKEHGRPTKGFLTPGHIDSDTSDSGTDTESVTAPPYSPITPSLYSCSPPESEVEYTEERDTDTSGR